MINKSLILLGAGASYLDGGPDRPPLGRQLFRPLRERFPESWGLVPEDLSPRFSEDFEVAMGEFAPSSDNLAQMTKDMAVFFSGFRPRKHGKEPYHRIVRGLAGQIKSHQLTIATMNYDCLLELSAKEAGFRTDYFGTGDGLRLLKLHGSCNFVVSDGNAKAKEVRIRQGGKIESTIVRPPPHPRDVPRILRTCLFPPAMALYTREKEVLSCNKQILQIQQLYASAARGASCLVVVGANPRLHDSHVWGPISESRAQIGFIGSRTAIEGLQGSFATREIKVLGETFEDSVDALMDFLRA